MMRFVAIAAFLFAASTFGENANAALSENTPLVASELGSGPSHRGLASCYTNLTEIFVSEGNVVDAAVPRTYTLCANTEFTLAVFTQQGLVGGNQPIQPRANSHYKCGDSGSSSNNCTFVSGSVGVAIAPNAYSEPLVNSTIQGITFTGLNLYGVAAQAGGQIAFIDCIFRDMSNSGPVNLDLSQLKRRRLQLPLRKSPSSDRSLATVDLNTTLEISFDRCVFIGNNDGPSQNYPGVITGITTTGTHIFLEVSNSLFTNNSYTVLGNGYAIQGDDTVTSKSNCFINNNFLNWGPVQVINNATLISSDNFGVSNGKVACPYADLTDLSFSYVHCVPYEATSCSFSNPAIPPTSAPVTTTIIPGTAAPAVPTGATPTSMPVATPPATPTISVPTVKPQPTAKSAATTTYQVASKVLTVAGISLCWILF